MCEGLKPQGDFDLVHIKSPQEGRSGNHLDLTAKWSLKKSNSCTLAVHKIFLIKGEQFIDEINVFSAKSLLLFEYHCSLCFLGWWAEWSECSIAGHSHILNSYLCFTHSHSYMFLQDVLWYGFSPVNLVVLCPNIPSIPGCLSCRFLVLMPSRKSRNNSTWLFLLRWAAFWGVLCLALWKYS